MPKSPKTKVVKAPNEKTVTLKKRKAPTSKGKKSRSPLAHSPSAYRKMAEISTAANRLAKLERKIATPEKVEKFGKAVALAISSPKYNAAFKRTPKMTGTSRSPAHKTLRSPRGSVRKSPAKFSTKKKVAAALGTALGVAAAVAVPTILNAVGAFAKHPNAAIEKALSPPEFPEPPSVNTDAVRSVIKREHAASERESHQKPHVNKFAGQGSLPVKITSRPIDALVKGSHRVGFQKGIEGDRALSVVEDLANRYPGAPLTQMDKIRAVLKNSPQKIARVDWDPTTGDYGFAFAPGRDVYSGFKA